MTPPQQADPAQDSPTTLVSQTSEIVEPALPEPVYLVDLWNFGGYGAGGNFAMRKFSDGQDLIAHGRHYRHGIWAHAESLGEWRLYNQYERLESDILLMNWEVCGDGVIFRVVVDGEVRFESGVVTQQTPPIEIEVDVRGGNVLRLEAGIGPAGDEGCDWAIWGDPVLYALPAIDVAAAQQTEFYVSPDGSDQNDGSIESPFATLEKARAAVRTINDNMAAPITVYLRQGVYQLEQPFYLSELDSGSNGFEISYQAYPGETPVLSGGLPVTGWQPVGGTQLWSTSIELSNPRQLYIDGRRAQRAQTAGKLLGLGWAAGDFSEKDGILIRSNALPAIADGHGMELHWIYEWKDMRVPVQSIETLANGQRVFWLQQPQFSWATNMAMFNDIYPKPDVGFIVENAYELLDQAGEWFYDDEAEVLYYWPLPREDMTASDAVVPVLEHLLALEGHGTGNEIRDIAFRGLTFSYSAWERASTRGAFGGQAQQLVDNGNPFLDYVLTPAAIEIHAAHNLTFEDNIVEHIGSAGVWLVNNVANMRIVGNIFRDISDSAVVVGMPGHAYIDLPNEAVAKDNLISNNLIRNVGVEYWGAPGISAFYTDGLHIVHNHLAELPYSGIALGWGWSSELASRTARNNLVENNLITDLSLRAGDAGGVYTLGQQPGTEVRGNVIRRLRAHFACLYPDEGSAGIRFDSNVCDTAQGWVNLWIHTVRDIYVVNTFTNVTQFWNSGTNIRIWDTVYVNGQNWPPEAQQIMNRAGLEPEYQNLLEK